VSESARLSQFGAGSCVAIEETVKHPCPRRLAYGGCDAGRTNLDWRLCNPTWMVDESTVSNNFGPIRVQWRQWWLELCAIVVRDPCQVTRDGT
jgi:hypothetical protein